MKKVCVCLVLALIAVALSVRARRPCRRSIRNGSRSTRTAIRTPSSSKQSNGQVQRLPRRQSKKMKNEYGKAVGKFLTKAKYNEIKEDEAAAQKYILEGLQKAEGEKSAAGKSYGELLKAGKLPAGV